MPIYEFTCRGCDTRFEELVKLNGASAAATCPECGSRDTMRLLSTFAVHRTATTAGAAREPATAKLGGGCCGGACGCG